DPEIVLLVEVKRADQVSELHGPEELAVAGIDNDAIFLTVADIDIAGFGIDGKTMGHGELALADRIAEPLVDELAILVQVQDARGAVIVGGIAAVGVVGALMAMALGDIDVAPGIERDHQGLPQQPLSLGFVPVAA